VKGTGSGHRSVSNQITLTGFLIGPETFRKENMHRCVVSVDVIDEIGFTSQQRTGIQTANASGDPVGGAFHCPGNGALVGSVKVKV